MKKIKLIKFIVLFFFVLSVFGITKEMVFQDHLRNFESTYPTAVYTLSANQTQDKMIGDLLKAAEKNNVKFFCVNTQNQSDFDRTINIYYSDESVIEHIEKRDLIKQGDYPGILESNKVNFYPLNELEISTSPVTHYLIGDINDLNNFNMELANTYGGDQISKAMMIEFDDSDVLIALLLIVIAVFVLLTIYEILVNKKEIAVSISLGAKARNVFLQNVLIDSVAIIFSYLISMAIFDYFKIMGFYGEIFVVSIIALLVSDILAFSSLFFIKIKNVFTGKINSKSLLTTSYLLKSISTVLAVLVFSISCATIKQAYDFYSQREFFEEKNYNFINATCYDEKGLSFERESQKMLRAMQKEYFKPGDITVMADICADKIGGKDLLLYNQNAGEYLFENIKSINKNDIANEKVTFFVPEDYLIDENIGRLKDGVDFCYEFYDEKDDFEYEVVYYKDNIKLLGFSNESYGNSAYSENPVIAYLNIDESQDTKIESLRGADCILSNISQNEAEGIFAKYNKEMYNEKFEITVTASSAYGSFQHYANLLNKSLYGSCFISLLLILLEILLIYFVIKLEYVINSKELALKKILGYTIFERHRKLIINTLITSFISIIAAIAINYSLKFSGIYYLLFGGIAVTLLDLAVALIFLVKAEKEQIQKILKGGAL